MMVIEQVLGKRFSAIHALLAVVTSVLVAGCTSTTPDVPAKAQLIRPPVIRQVLPSLTDSRITRFNDAHYVAIDPVRDRTEAPLVLFMAGTNGKPREVVFFPTLLRAGHRVISIAYNTGEAIQQVCPNNPDTECAAKTRHKRIYGNNTINVIDDEPQDAIVPRLTALLKHLAREYPGEKWDRYLNGDAVNWSRVIVTGQSQGAGMAAFIAQEHLVARAVLFSSPWDSYGRPIVLAPWLTRHSVTPPARWYAGYHGKENTARLIGRAYTALRIPEANVRVWTAEPDSTRGPNPYHGVGVSRFNSPENFVFMFGLEENLR